MASMFWVLSKQKNSRGDETSRYAPFLLNRIQGSVETNLAQNNLVGKPRQTGFTTYFSLRRLLLPATTDTGVGCQLISQSGEYAGEHFQIIRRAHRLYGALDPFDYEVNTLSRALLENVLHTQYSNRKELVYDYLDSKVRIASAEVEESGQGITLHHVLADEYARWPGNPDATLANIKGALVPGGTVDKVSTANGAVGPYFDDVMLTLNDPKASDSKLHYYSWWWEDGYRDTEFYTVEGELIDLANASRKEVEQCIADLTADELRLIKKIHYELKGVAYVS